MRRFAGMRGQRVHHRVQRLRIGIVAIVDDRDVAQLDDLPALVGGRESRQRCDRLCEAHAPFAAATATAASAL